MRKILKVENQSNLQWTTLQNYIKQVYLADGCYLRGYLYASRNSNNPIKINGHGIISADIWPFHYPANTYDQSNFQKWYKLIQIYGGSNHVVKGLTLMSPTGPVIGLHADNVLIKNVNINGFKYNNDAIETSGSHLIVDECFIRDNEDEIVVGKGDLKVTNCIFWQLYNGSIIQLGWTPHSIEVTI